MFQTRKGNLRRLKDLEDLEGSVDFTLQLGPIIAEARAVGQLSMHIRLLGVLQFTVYHRYEILTMVIPVIRHRLSTSSRDLRGVVMSVLILGIS